MKHCCTILQVLPALNAGGVEVGTVQTAKAIKKHNMVSLVVSNGGRMVNDLEACGSTHIQLPVHSKNPLIMFLNVWRLMNIIKAYNVDLVHVRSRAPAWSVWAAANLSKIPWITTFHGAYGHQNAVKRFYNKIMTRGAAIISISNFITNYLKNIYHIHDDKIHLVYRGVDEHHIKQVLTLPDRTKKQLLLRKEHGIKKDDIVFLTAARVTEWKGHDVAIHAMAKVIKSSDIEERVKDTMKLVFVGAYNSDDGYYQRCIQHVKGLGLQDHIIWINHRSNILDYFDMADIVLSTTSLKPEAFGRTMAEAGMMGKIVIASKHGGAMDIIKHNVTGYLVKPGSVDELADKMILTVGMDADKRELMQKAAATHTKNYFTETSMTEKTLDIYQKILDNRNSTH